MASANDENLNTAQDLRNIEAATARALKNIQRLYDEILTPCKESDYPDPQLFDHENTVDDSDVSVSTSTNDSALSKKRTQKYYDDELCYSCKSKLEQRRISTSKTASVRPHTANSTKRKKQSNVRHFDTSFSEKDRFPSQNKDSNVTVPEPFSFSARDSERKEARELKLRKLKEELDMAMEKELKVKIQTKPVPEHTRLPLYKSIVEQNEKRKQERKEKVKNFTLLPSKSTVTYSSLSVSLKRTKSSSNLNAEPPQALFRAKPAPKSILSNKVNETLRNREKMRKVYMSQRAEQQLKQSALPFTEKKINRSFSLINLSEFKKKPGEERLKNLSNASKNGYAKKCEDALKDWNKKVSLITCPKNVSSTKENKSADKSSSTRKSRPLSRSESLPFYDFPVRMTTAAMLKEKQTKLELLTRKFREEQQRVEHEDKIRKDRELKKNIWPKLQSMDPTSDATKEIERNIKSLQASQLQREQEYEKELQTIMERVSNQLLLIERQTKETRHVYARKVDTEEFSVSNRVSSNRGSNNNSVHDDATVSSSPNASDMSVND